jgi:hypothetical protein
MKPNGVKKDGNKKAFGLSNKDRYVSGIASVLNFPFIYLAELCLDAPCAALGEFEF